MEEKLKQQHAEHVDLQNENDDLKCKGGALSKVHFDLLESRINLANSSNLEKDSKIL